MINRYKQIFLLYLRNSTFLALASILLLTGVLSKVLYHQRLIGLAEDIFTILFIVSLWLAFHIGILLKRQFSTHRASLLPHYRQPKINFAIGLYLIFIVLIFLWEWGFRIKVGTLEISRQGLWAIDLTCLLVATLVMYLGYLSIGRILIYAYIALLIFASQAFNIMSIVNSEGYFAYVIAGLSGVFVLFFCRRLLSLREEHFEYGHIFSWPPRQLMTSQLQANQRLTDFLTPFMSVLSKQKKTKTVPPYPRQSNILARTYHWDYTEQTDSKGLWVFMILLIPIVLLLQKNQPMLQNFNNDIYSNFLLLSISPVLVTMGANYKRIAYWGYDILKPVNKPQYMKEQAIGLLTQLLLYWLLFAVCFAILPRIIFQPKLFWVQKFWSYLGLTANVSLAVLCWVAFLCCVRNSWVVIINGLALGLLVIFYFCLASKLSIEEIVFHNLVCFVLAVFLMNKAYQAWCEKEFLE